VKEFRSVVLIVVLIFCVILTTCSTPKTDVNAQIATGAVQTLVVGAIQKTAIATAMAGLTQAAAALPQSTPLPVAISTPLATATIEPTKQPAVSIAPTVVRSGDWAIFVSETIPDGSNISPGVTFTKTWTLKNVGTTTWNADYLVVFVRGDSLNAPTGFPLPKEVKPGETVSISVDFLAPSLPGTFRGEWKLRNDKGSQFGIGPFSNTFWFSINVVK
jgi:hypothetical protein